MLQIRFINLQIRSPELQIYIQTVRIGTRQSFLLGKNHLRTTNLQIYRYELQDFSITRFSYSLSIYQLANKSIRLARLFDHLFNQFTSDPYRPAN